MPSLRSQIHAPPPILALCLTLAIACASAPAAPPKLATASVMVTNPLETPIRVYQLYQTRPVFDPRLSSALCAPLGEVAARDSARFAITAGANDYIGVVFQADSLNGIPAGVSRAMQARSGDDLRWNIVRDTRAPDPPRLQRGVMSTPNATSGVRERNRC